MRRWEGKKFVLTRPQIFAGGLQRRVSSAHVCVSAWLTDCVDRCELSRQRVDPFSGPSTREGKGIYHGSDPQSSRRINHAGKASAARPGPPSPRARTRTAAGRMVTSSRRGLMRPISLRKRARFDVIASGEEAPGPAVFEAPTMQNMRRWLDEKDWKSNYDLRRRDKGEYPST